MQAWVMDEIGKKAILALCKQLRKTLAVIRRQGKRIRRLEKEAGLR